MSRLLQISDTHFGTEQPAVADALRALVQAEQVEHVLLAGDITMRARRGQFAAARAFMDSLPVQTRMTLPGNHDISLWLPWRRFLWPYRLYQQYFPTAFDTDGVIHWDLGPIHLIGVRTTRRYRHIQGEASPAQIANVSRSRRKSARTCCAVPCKPTPAGALPVPPGYWAATSMNPMWS
jgi:hypothetical protein